MLSVPPNLSYRFIAIPIKISVSYLIDTYKLIINFYGKTKALVTVNTILKNKVGALTT